MREVPNQPDKRKRHSQTKFDLCRIKKARRDAIDVENGLNKGKYPEDKNLRRSVDEKGRPITKVVLKQEGLLGGAKAMTLENLREAKSQVEGGTSRYIADDFLYSRSQPAL